MCIRDRIINCATSHHKVSRSAAARRAASRRIVPPLLLLSSSSLVVFWFAAGVSPAGRRCDRAWSAISSQGRDRDTEAPACRRSTPAGCCAESRTASWTRRATSSAEPPRQCLANSFVTNWFDWHAWPAWLRRWKKVSSVQLSSVRRAFINTRLSEFAGLQEKEGEATRKLSCWDGGWAYFRWRRGGGCDVDASFAELRRCSRHVAQTNMRRWRAPVVPQLSRTVHTAYLSSHIIWTGLIKVSVL